MKLYFSPGACSLASRIVACEAGLAIDCDKVDLKTRVTASGRDFSRINPKGHVPALALDDGEVLTEGVVILQYLADQAPETGLMPETGCRERYRVQEWLSFISVEIYKGFAPLWTPATPDVARRMAVEDLHRHFGYIDGHLEGRSYLMGERYTVADAYCFTVLNWTGFHRIDLSAYPRLVAFMDRVAARPKVREALKAEGLLRVA
ncbi:glutathione transferase GstA [Microvirga terricola]|uniref:Glutathione transferase GstA n=1 Tax=Microvirga terricola TaxID=2719797 RepID=A0ABX0VF73_9HYPH|nr:glutathione transferase GstA [Microvirga terricola]NIX76996.1 glutathione transferase GstA [Microvirga terricola]